MCTNKYNDKNKTNLHPFPLQAFWLFLLTVLRKIECNCMSRLFFIDDLSDVGTAFFFNFMVFKPTQANLK